MSLSRRHFIAGLGAALALPTAAAVNEEFDLDDPEVNLRAFVKLIGALDGEPVYDIVRGSVYGLTPGRPAQPLFRTVGAGMSVYTQHSALEYHAASRYVGLLLDWETQLPLERWTNPLNGAECEVPVTRYGPGEMRILGDRMLPVGTDSAAQPGGVRPWFRLGDVVHMQREILQGAVERPLFPKGDLMTYSGDGAQLADPAVLRMPSRLNFAAVESWRGWMKVDPEALPGTLWWHVSGVKLAAPRDYSASLRAWIMRADPDFFTAG